MIRVALRPVAPFYGLAARTRSWAYRAGLLSARRLPAVVISVGNLTVGGTGKTPFVAWLAERLLRDEKPVGILTRGYPGFAQGTRATGEPDEVALLRARLAGRVPIGMGKDRFAAAQPLLEQGIEWFVLDDGFQHYSLQRDADVVLVDSTDPFGGGLLPAGRAREPRTALRRADVLVITRTEHAPGLVSLLQQLSSAPIFYATTAFETLVVLPTGRGAGPPEKLAEAPVPRGGSRYFVFCGIGNPEAFFSDLRRWEPELRGTLVGKRFFRDHHRYSADDLREIENAARAAGATAVICTEKDAWNLPAPLPLSLPVSACRVRLQPVDEEGMFRAILKIVPGPARRGAGR
jgi:tetraacyldisaccharide 4'-kinase